jgi:hypothetical protein
MKTRANEKQNPERKIAQASEPQTNRQEVRFVNSICTSTEPSVRQRVIVNFKQSHSK